MNNKKLLATGVIGTIIAALCCFTPEFVVLFGVVGLSAMVGYLDYVLMPALGLFICLTIYAVWRFKQKTQLHEHNEQQ
jgi:mercuric ion transport protein